MAPTKSKRATAHIRKLFDRPCHIPLARRDWGLKSLDLRTPPLKLFNPVVKKHTKNTTVDSTNGKIQKNIPIATPNIAQFDGKYIEEAKLSSLGTDRAVYMCDQRKVMFLLTFYGVSVFHCASALLFGWAPVLAIEFE